MVEVTNLSVAPDSVLSFTVPKRELFRERPGSLDDVRHKKVTWAGVTRDELFMRGRLEAGRLVVTCTSKGYACPDDLGEVRPSGRTEHRITRYLTSGRVA